jgi:ABC-type spermidine/putrescine transport system permease subunit II
VRFACFESMLSLSRSVEVALAVASVAMFVATIIAIPIFLVRVPGEYFARPRRARSLPIRILRTVCGLALVALGGAMLVLPGQGVMTILVGLGVLDLPINHRIVLKILCRPKVHEAIDDLRRKHGKEPLQLPGTFTTSPAT